MRPQTMAAALVSVQQAIDNCTLNEASVEPNEIKSEWRERWLVRFAKLTEMIPTGSGIDQGPNLLSVKPTEISFDTGYHHMNEHGSYDGWTEHTIRIRPAFDGLDVKISGRDRNDVKDHLYEVFEYAFTRHVEWSELEQRWITESDEQRYAAEERAYPRNPQPEVKP